MARQPQITRTIQTTHAIVLCMDLEHAEPCNKEVTLPRTYKDSEAMLKAAKAVLDTENIKAVHVVASEVKDTLYGMSEADFITHAVVLPPRKDYTNKD